MQENRSFLSLEKSVKAFNREPLLFINSDISKVLLLKLVKPAGLKACTVAKKFLVVRF